MLCRVKYPACARYDARDVRLQYACAALQCVCLFNRHDVSRCRSLHTCGLLSRSLLLCLVSASVPASVPVRCGKTVPDVSARARAFPRLAAQAVILRPPGLAPIRVGHGHIETKNYRSDDRLRLAAPSTASGRFRTGSCVPSVSCSGSDSKVGQSLQSTAHCTRTESRHVTYHIASECAQKGVERECLFVLSLRAREITKVGRHACAGANGTKKCEIWPSRGVQLKGAGKKRNVRGAKGRLPSKRSVSGHAEHLAGELDVVDGPIQLYSHTLHHLVDLGNGEASWVHGRVLRSRRRRFAPQSSSSECARAVTRVIRNAPQQQAAAVSLCHT